VPGNLDGTRLPAFLQTGAGRRFMNKYDIFQTRSVAEDLAAINGRTSLECGSLLPLSGAKLASRDQSGGKPPHSKFGVVIRA
jgi:hypothetical protein